jgi:AcrR family transcriptional regulator
MTIGLSEMAAPKKRTSATGEETQARIVAATIRTLKAEGIKGTSARAIAREGDFNQALIFYHFGSVDELVIASVAELSTKRMARHQVRLEEADKLSDLIRIARVLNAEDRADDNMTVLTQAFAGAAGDPEMGPKLYDELEPWNRMLSESIVRVLGHSPIAQAVPHEKIAQAIGALFLGIELLDDLDPERANAEQLFDTLEPLATMLENLLDSPLLQALNQQPS